MILLLKRLTDHVEASIRCLGNIFGHGGSHDDNLIIHEMLKREQRVTSNATPVTIDEEESLQFKGNIFRAAADDSSKNHN